MKAQLTTTARQPKSVACPVCKAEVGAGCLSETGKKARRFHSARLREAELAELESVTVSDVETRSEEPAPMTDAEVVEKLGPDALTPGTELAPGIIVVEDVDPHTQALRDAAEPPKPGKRSAKPKADTGAEPARSKPVDPIPSSAPEGTPGIVKDAYSKVRDAVKAADGTVSIYTPSRDRWFATKDLRVAASFKANA